MMMTLDSHILASAEAARERVLEHQHELDRARVDLNHDIRRLHAAGGSMREISEKLGVSHQRVHQIISDGEDPSDSMLRKLTERLREAGSAFTRFTDEARRVVQHSHELADQLGARAVEPSHLLLALAAPKSGASARALAAAGIDPAALRAAITDGDSPGERNRRGRVSFPGSTKKALELSLREAIRLGDDRIGSEHLLRGLLRTDDDAVNSTLNELGVTPTNIHEALEAH
jgi:transcriptional regulator with XRE-family HTH domain